MQVFKSFGDVREVIIRVFQPFDMAARCRGWCGNLCKDVSAVNMVYVVDNTRHEIWFVQVEEGNGPVLSILFAHSPPNEPMACR